jgi:hypothetical protein
MQLPCFAPHPELLIVVLSVFGGRLSLVSALASWEHGDSCACRHQSGQQGVGSLYICADRTAVALYMYDSPASPSPLPTPLKRTVLTT